MLFEVTAEIQNAAKPIIPGWHPCEVVKMDESRADDGVMKATITHKLLDGPDKGKMFWVTIYSDHRMSMNMNYLDFQTNGAFSRPVKPGDKAKKDFVLANFVHRQFDCKIKNSVDKENPNRTMNNLQDQSKLGSKEYAWKIEKKQAAATT